MSDSEELDFEARIAALDATLTERKQRTAYTGAPRRTRTTLKQGQREKQADSRERSLDQPGAPETPSSKPDPLPTDGSGWYRIHVVHRSIGVEFDMLLNPQRKGAALYHDATMTIGDKKR